MIHRIAPPRFCVVFLLAAPAMVRPGEAFASGPCETDPAGAECDTLLTAEANRLKKDTARLRAQVDKKAVVKTGTSVKPGASKPSEPKPLGSRTTPPPLPPGPPTIQLAELQESIVRAEKILRARRLACRKSQVDPPADAPCPKAIEAEQQLLVVAALALTLSDCEADGCPEDKERAALLDQVKLALAEDAEGVAVATAVKKARALGLTGEMVLDLLPLAARAEKELTELGRAADAAASAGQAPADVVAGAKRVIERARSGALHLWQALEELPSEERVRVVLLLQSLANPGSRHVAEPRLRLAVVRSKPENRQAEDAFLYSIKEVLVATTNMALRPEDEAKTRGGVERVRKQCEDETKEVCDGVLEISYSVEDKKLKATGRLHFPARASGQAPATRDEEVEVPLAGSTPGCSSDPAHAPAAYSLLRRLSASYAVLSELEYLGYSRARPVLVGRTCGSDDARIFEVHVAQQTPTLGKGFVFQTGDCPSDFNDGLRERLGDLPFFRDLTDSPKANSTLASAKVVTAAPGDQLEQMAAAMPNKCEVSLREDATSAPFYTLRTYWSQNGFEAGSLSGIQAAKVVTSYYLDRDESKTRAARGSGSPPKHDEPVRSQTFDRAASPGWEANRGNALFGFFSPGLPWLADDVASWNGVGVGVASLDVALLLGAATSYALATDLRYRHSDDPGNASLLDDSARARNLGNGLLITAGALRVAAFLGYLISPPTDQAGKTGARALAQPLTWTF